MGRASGSQNNFTVDDGRKLNITFIISPEQTDEPWRDYRSALNLVGPAANFLWQKLHLGTLQALK